MRRGAGRYPLPAAYGGTLAVIRNAASSHPSYGDGSVLSGCGYGMWSGNEIYRWNLCALDQIHGRKIQRRKVHRVVGVFAGHLFQAPPRWFGQHHREEESEGGCSAGDEEHSPQIHLLLQLRHEEDSDERSEFADPSGDAVTGGAHADGKDLRWHDERGHVWPELSEEVAESENQ